MKTCFPPTFRSSLDAVGQVVATTFFNPSHRLSEPPR